MAGDKIQHPTPAEAFQQAANHAALLRALFLPAGATRKCKDETSTLKDKEGNVKTFPKLNEEDAVEKVNDVISRGFMTRKIILENATDMKARILIGGQAFPFVEAAEKAVKEAYPW
ncbi:hypothetical protein F5B19DRAFT_498121 [Rostrohypoxylon terebratum]|nr:hypothetical protein F5B19DRAFT_498121 [Rostrohypoxylon terebratum]